jgi:hypothetical protein
MKVIAKFFWDCGRSGEVEGIFTCEKETLQNSYGREVYFGEILGKHSEVSGTLHEDAITILSEDQDFIEKFEEILGTGTVSGYNPLEYIEDYGDDDEV